MSKICTKCGIEKDEVEFNKCNRNKNGFRAECKVCQKINYYENKQHYNRKTKENRLSKIDEYKKRDKINYEKNKEYILKQKKFYYDNNKEKILIKKKVYYENNREILSEKYKVWVESNKEYVREYHKLYSREYRKNNPHVVAWRNLIKSTVARLGTKKEKHSIDELGYSASELKEHLEKQFTDGMSWDNYGKWHVDHILGVKNFEPETPFNIVNSLNNLQPLWGPDNIRKG